MALSTISRFGVASISQLSPACPYLSSVALNSTVPLTSPLEIFYSALSWLAPGQLSVDHLDGDLVLTANLDGPGLELAFDGQLATLTAAGFDPNPFLDAPELLSLLSGSLSFQPASNSWTGALEGKIVIAGNGLRSASTATPSPTTLS